MWKSLLLLTLLLAAAPAAAHHGAAAFALGTPTTLESATVTAFDWRNPHALIHFTVKDQKWTAETAGLIILNRAGWTRNSVKAGDQVTIVGFAAKNGSPTMILQRIVFADGRELTTFVPK